ncbi:acyl-CoA dehydrogenase family protein [Nonomuraea typhae]|uniref:acyl-CoA dehydrogenase family protein n=1 Tax=Nonomuraea typhae TaxID=2603600 RepID=UPI0012FAFE25|nr:acyl-CoA dehydrogenase family protein [Nonomuraea typhae]
MDLLRGTVRSYLSRRPSATWADFAQALGVAGLAVPEEYGGAGCGPEEVASVARELGRALSPQPFLQTAVLAVEALKRDGDREARERLLPPLAEGSTTATVIFASPSYLPGPTPQNHLELANGSLSGEAPYVLEGDLVLVYAGGHLAEARPAAREPYTTMDTTRPLSRLVFDRTPATILGGDAHMEEVRALGIAALAAEQAGGAERCLEAAVEYAKQRRQFGQPIGAFQAIKHKLADVALLVESARSAALAAHESATNAAIAGAYCGDAYLRAAGENIQVHGGIGITWEHDAHRYFKRATSDARLFRTPREHRELLARELF